MLHSTYNNVKNYELSKIFITYIYINYFTFCQSCSFSVSIGKIVLYLNQVENKNDKHFRLYD